MSSPATSALVAPVALGAVLIAVTATLSGCTAILHELHGVHEERFSSHAAAARGWVGVPFPAWIPEDAREVRNRATKEETNSILRVVTESPPAGDCVLSERLSLPFETTSWADELSPPPDEVLLCQGYELVTIEDGWLGWFNASEPGERPV